MPSFSIRQCLPCDPDWYIISVWYDSPKPDRWFIERVLLWAVGAAEGEIDHVRAIDSQGHPVENDSGDTYYAHGQDPSPYRGMTWAEIYRSTAPTPLNVREFTELAAAE